MNYNEEISDIQESLLNDMPESYSKLKGTWLWEMFKAFSLRIYEFLQLLTDTAKKMNVENLKGDELDAYVLQWTDLKRKKAQRAEGYIDVVGNGIIYGGTVVSNGSVRYVVAEDTKIRGSTEVKIVAEEAGEAGNTDKNTVTVMVTSNANVKSITNSKPIEGGIDEETDEALRERYHFRLSMPATSGNRSHYILWATECIGVGSAKAVRDAVIPNKVNLYICDDSGGAADETTVGLVQEYIDPNRNGDGSGTAPIGAICEVFSAGIKNIKVSGTVELDNTKDEEDTLANIRADIVKYLSQINFQKTELSYAKMLNVVIGSIGVNDISDFKINDSYANILCDETEIFVLNDFEMGGEVKCRRLKILV